MERANGKNFFAACDDLKRKASCKVSNLFVDSHELNRKLAGHDCYFHQSGQSLFLLLPSHGEMRSLLFVSASQNALSSDLPELLRHAEMQVPVKTSIIGREKFCDSLVSILEENGFTIIKKLLRMLLGRPDEKTLSAMRMLAADYAEMADFAAERDAEEIIAMILEEFDIVGDNIPEPDEIMENIRKKNVTVIRMDGKIASLHYFHVENGIAHGYFDITSKEFRGGNGLIFALNIFEHDYFQKMGIKINRTYGWRDASKTRLVKSSSKTSSFPDGIVIYNMLRETGSERNCPDGQQS